MKQIQRYLQFPYWAKAAMQNITIAVMLLLFSAGISTGADFTLDFQNDEVGGGVSRINNGGRFSATSYTACNMSYIANSGCAGGDFGFGINDGMGLAAEHDDGSAFFQEELFDSSDGQRYFHVIVGDYTTDDMVLEYFIKANANSNQWDSGFFGFSGSGNISASHSLGQAGNGAAAIGQPYSADSSLTGTGSANPNSIIMRQLVKDSASPSFSIDFTKERFLYKPKLTHTNGGVDGFEAITVIDMSNSLYTDITPVDGTADFDNVLVLTDPLKYETAGDYNVDTAGSLGPEIKSYYNVNPNGEIREFTAGGFTYTPGSGTGGSGGTYNYIDSADNANPAYNPLNVDWVSFCDTSQNVNWSGNGACTNGDGSGGGWGGGWGGGGWGGWR
ncbi:hypothetical protein MNBD_GAMMA17-781 [hydrothermal vent metagenome]|uniref:Uncharacterized protein n=1 Tax=hydrothermal vent metagenome TaxID=652676 RepID=A0A3B0ZHE3_9ZZZZ